MIKKIFNHLDLWDVKGKPHLCANPLRTESLIIYDMSSAPSADDCLINADYPIDLLRRSSTCWVVLSVVARRAKTEVEAVTELAVIL